MNTQQKGKLIVIDGGDGSGKTTQAKLLIEYLQKQNTSVKYVDFPQYETFYGKTVAAFLRGEFGDINSVSPYLASLAYALDRASIKEDMQQFLNQNGYIIANRYATSNMAHQGSKFENPEDREKFLQWVYEMEYEINKLPKEDIVVYLYVPWQITQELTKLKGNREYLQGQQQDIHEADHDHRRKTEEMYKELAKKYPHWVMIDCTKDGQIMPIEEIHLKMLQVLREKSII